MNKIKRLAWQSAILAAITWPNAASAQNASEAEPLPLNDYLELRRFSQISSAARIAQSNLRQKEIIKNALAYSPTARELVASQLAAGQDTLSAKGAKAPQVTALAQSIVSEGDLANASKNKGNPGATLQAVYTVYDWGRIDAIVNGRKE